MVPTAARDDVAWGGAAVPYRHVWCPCRSAESHSLVLAEGYSEHRPVASQHESGTRFPEGQTESPSKEADRTTNILVLPARHARLTPEVSKLTTKTVRCEAYRPLAGVKERFRGQPSLPRAQCAARRNAQNLSSDLKAYPPQLSTWTC